MFSTVAENPPSATPSSPDGDAVNILLAVLALLVIIAVMCGVVICIIRKSTRDGELYYENVDDEEMGEMNVVEIEEKQPLTSTTSWL